MIVPNQTPSKHQWTLRLAGDCLLDIEFELYPGGSIGLAKLPNGWERRAGMYGFPEHVVGSMVRSYRSGYNDAILRVRELAK